MRWDRAPGRHHGDAGGVARNGGIAVQVQHQGGDAVLHSGQGGGGGGG